MRAKIFLISILMGVKAFAIFGAGDIVSDPTSYSYYAKEIKTLNDQLTTALDTLDQVDKVNAELDKVSNILDETGGKILNPKKKLLGLVNSMKSVKSRFERLANKVEGIGVDHFFKEHHNVKAPMQAEIMKKWKENYDALFDDAKDEKYQILNEEVASAIKSNNYKKYQKSMNDLNTYMKLKNIEKEAVKKYSLLATTNLYNDYFMSEEVTEERKQQDERIQKYIDQIETASDMHKQQQTTNLILIELLGFVQSQYEMQMKFFNAISLNSITDGSKYNYDLTQVVEQREDFTTARDTDILKTSASKLLESFLNDMEKKGKSNSIFKRLDY